MSTETPKRSAPKPKPTPAVAAPREVTDVEKRRGLFPVNVAGWKSTVMRFMRFKFWLFCFLLICIYSIRCVNTS